jgi:tetratricopeptide (TPR) repeat protein
MFYLESDMELFAIETLVKAQEHGLNDPEMDLAIGLAYNRLYQKYPNPDKKPPCNFELPVWPPPSMSENQYLQEAVMSSEDPLSTQRFIEAYLALLELDQKGVDEMEIFAAQGNDKAIALLRRYYEEISDLDNWTRILELSAKKGNVFLYNLIATLHLQVGNFDPAIAAQLRAVEACLPNACGLLAKLLQKKGRMIESTAYNLKQLAEYYEERQLQKAHQRPDKNALS